MALPEFTKSQEWLTKHLQSIGGSAAGTVMGLSRFRTPRQLYDAMNAVLVKGQRPDPGSMSDDMRRGLILEPVAFDLVTEALAVPTCRHDQDDFITNSAIGDFAHSLPDGWAGPTPIELKVPRPGTIAKCNLQGLIKEWQAQAQHTMAVTRTRLCIVGLMDPMACRVHVFEVERDDGYIKFMLRTEEQFYARVVESKPPPEVTYARVDDGEAETGIVKVVNTPEAVRAAIAFNRLKELIAEAEDGLDDCKAKLRELAGDSPRFVVPNAISVSDRTSKEGWTVDAEALGKYHPKVARDERIYRRRAASRRFVARSLEGGGQ